MLALLALNDRLDAASPAGTAFTYQGRLNEGANPANGRHDFRFVLYDAEVGGVQQGGVLTNCVTVSGGLFTVTLDFGARFDGNARWLEIGVRTNGSGEFTPLSPRQPLNPTPYAAYAPNAGTATTATTATQAGSVAAGSVNTAGLAPGAVDSTRIADGSIAANDLSPALASNTFWRLRGNAGTSSLDFLGTVDATSLKLRVNNLVGWRLEPTAEGRPNVIGGGGNNAVATYGAFIGGGDYNSVAANSSFSLIGGGLNNSIASSSSNAIIAGGFLNKLAGSASWSGIHGGGYNSIDSEAFAAVIGGGYANGLGTNAFASTMAGGYFCTIGNGASSSSIGGGAYNHILDGAYGATIAGGQNNTNGGRNSMVPGGVGNAALGEYSFAAGVKAKAQHPGAFVWADSQWVDFASTANNQFLIRASGGVGINKNNPGSALDVDGTVSATGFNAGGPVRLNDNEVYFHPNDIFHGLGWYGNPRYFAGINVNGPVLYGFGGGALGYTGNGTNVALLWNAYGNVGIGKVNPATALDVNGTVTATSFRGAAGSALSLGTADTLPLHLMINNQTGLRLEPGGSNSVNIIGGWSQNHVAPGVIGATIAGGGSMKLGDDRNRINQVQSDFGTVSGGAAHYIGTRSEDSSIGGGFRNMINGGLHATIGGGYGNSILVGGDSAVIGGGWINTVLASSSTISGGYLNEINTSAYGGSIGGGANNKIQQGARSASVGGGALNLVQTNGDFAAIPGGYDNSAASYAFAAGTRAKANHTGTFVWSDSTWGEFSSTSSNQFLIRASAGVAINKNNPVSALDVSGTVTANAFSGSGGNVYGLNAANLSSGTLDDARLSGNVALLNAGQTFTGAKTFTDHVRVSDRQVYLRGGLDNYHGLGWFLSSSFAGANPDGPVLYGFAGGSLGTTAGGQKIALAWNSSGNVGIGTANPATTLEVNGEVRAATVTATSQLRLYSARTVIAGFDGNGSHWFGPSPDSDLAFELRRSAANNYSFTLKGDFYGRSFNLTSDRNQKENFKPVDSQAVLEKVAALPISEWNYTSDAAVPHIGPMAQDFHAAFNVGTDNKHIATVDADGVALAAIKGLNEKVENGKQRVDSRMERLEAENAELKARLERLEALLSKQTGGAE